MKTLLIFLLAILVIGCHDRKAGSRTITGTGTGWQQVTKKQHFKDSTYFTKSVSTVYGDLKNSQVGVFNVLDYGATSGGIVEDQTAIQAAINAAYDYGNGTSWGGTVIIPDGDWYITSCDTVKSYVTIKIGKGARFLFPANYSGCMWYNMNSSVRLEKCVVDGGYYYCSTPTWDFVRLTSTSTTGIVFNEFKNLYVANCNLAFKLTQSGDGWINANNVINSVIDKPIEFLKPRGEIMGNIFDNIQIQSETTTTFIIDSLAGDYNYFTNIVVWDAIGGTQHLAILTSDAQYNVIEISNAGVNTAYHDLGNHNLIIKDGQIVSATFRSLRGEGDIYFPTDSAGSIKFSNVGYPNAYASIQGINNGGSDVADLVFKTAYGTASERLRILGNGNIGVWNSAPLGRLHIGSRPGSEPTYRGDIIIDQEGTSLAANGGLEIKSEAFGAGYGYRIVGAAASGGYDLHFQNRMGSATWTSKMILPNSGGLVTIAADTTVAKAYGKIIFQSADSTLYVCRFIRPTGKKCWFPLN